MIRRTGSPVSSPIASHRSWVSVFAYACMRRYRRIPSRNRSRPNHCSSMRRTAPPFVYVSVSNIPLASLGECTGYSIGRVVSNASISNAFARIRWNTSKTFQSGSMSSTQR
jgi:hypothetical protein